MNQSNSNLLNYIGLLLSDDTALNNFLVDPITESEEKNGLTKAERSVLRRTVAHLSNKSVNGFTMARHLGSYRRSLRLLQNVLHNVGSKMVQDSMISPSDSEAAIVVFTYSVVIYFPNSPKGSVDFTCKTNAVVESPPFGGPYSNYRIYTVKLPNPSPNIQQVMDEVNRVYGFKSYIPVTIKSDIYVKSITPFVGANTITADLSNPCYDLKKNPNADCVFWFYSVNGNPGKVGTSFAKTILKPNDTVFWQLIAPDAEYGFQKCLVTVGNAYAAK